MIACELFSDRFKTTVSHNAGRVCADLAQRLERRSSARVCGAVYVYALKIGCSWFYIGSRHPCFFGFSFLKCAVLIDSLRAIAVVIGVWAIG